MNRKFGIGASIATLAGVVGFAISMLADNLTLGYLASLLIALGFVPLTASFAAYRRKGTRAAAYTALAFAIIYAVIISLVYFAQLTTVRQSALSEQAQALLDYQRMGSLYFNYDLLGYGFMALATLFIGLTINVKTRADRWLKGLLMVHSVFAISCFALPILGVFSSYTFAKDLTGSLILLFWCAYFIPVCVLALLHFWRKGR